MRGLFSAVSELLFPSLCPICDAASCGGSFACPGCRQELAQVRPVSPGAGERAPFGIPHLAGGRYDGVLRKAILAYKLGRRDELLPELARIAAAAFDSDRFGGTTDLLAVAVPSAPRGDPPVDRVEALAAEIARRIGIPFVPGAIVRRMGAAGQVGRSRGERLARAGERLAVGAPSLKETARLLIVDDIITTGATISVVRDLLIAKDCRVVGALAVAAVD